MTIAQPATRAQRIEHKVDSWVNVGLAVLAGYVLASWLNHVPLLQQKAAEIPQLKHQVVVAHAVAAKAQVRAVNAEKDRDLIVRSINSEAARKPKPPG